MLTLDAFRPIYQSFLESGKTVRQFCADYPIHESRFYHWQAKLRQEASAQSPAGEFLPVSVNNVSIRPSTSPESETATGISSMPVAVA